MIPRVTRAWYVLSQSQFLGWGACGASASRGEEGTLEALLVGAIRYRPSREKPEMLA